LSVLSRGGGRDVDRRFRPDLMTVIYDNVMLESHERVALSLFDVCVDVKKDKRSTTATFVG
jgi:hypothetical protein